MAWRFVKQPNGFYARFSEIVDDFTDYQLSPEDAHEFDYCTYVIDEKLKRADANPHRWKEAIGIIEAIHGQEQADWAQDCGHAVPYAQERE